MKIPKDFPVRPLKPNDEAKDRATCGTCGLSWDDAIPTSMTPAPSARCPFEAFHKQSRQAKQIYGRRGVEEILKRLHLSYSEAELVGVCCYLNGKYGEFENLPKNVKFILTQMEKAGKIF